MDRHTLIEIAYIAASIFFIFGIKMLGRAETARKGNLISSIGMLIAVCATLLYGGMDYTWIIVGILVGSAVGIVTARTVKMTAMPELVALLNGFGGLASLLVGWAEFEKIREIGFDAYLVSGGSTAFSNAVIWLAVSIGGITFTGSILAYLKLSGKVGGAAIVFPAQKLVNFVVMALLLGAAAGMVALGDIETVHALLIAAIIMSLLLGVLAVLPIGGGDMPVVISLLNSFSGLAASAAGFVIGNTVLIVAGCLVGASGFILTIIMCKAMNRTLRNVLFSGFGATAQSGDAVEGEMKGISVEDAFYVLEAARNVLFVPGYGMAVAQAQHVVKELGNLLEENGAEVRYAIHPVAGRMPGHMNVLLAEADVPYEQLAEMAAVNPTMDMVDVALVIGANDVVNPSAADDPSSPIYGMPILEVHRAKTVLALKRGKGAGFSGLVNKLYFLDKTRMIYGDAKGTIQGLVAQFKEK